MSAANGTFDAIVIGASGGVGSAALYHLAGRGLNVLGLDRFPPGHNRGSSHGRTRIIRQAYFEHPDYVPMLHEAYSLWDELGSLRGAPLLHETGLLQIGPPDGVVVRGVLASAQEHGLAVEQLSGHDVTSRWSGFHVPEGLVGLYERRAGYLDVEQCVIAHAEEAMRRGAVLRSEEEVLSWRHEGSHYCVETRSGPFWAARLVIAAGPWSGALLGNLGIKLVVRRKPQYWFRPATLDAYQASAGYPAYLYELPEGIFYGFPTIDELGVKMAQHTGGAEVADPLLLDQGIDPDDLQSVRQFAARCLPAVTPDLLHHEPCMYTLSADEHFILDRHPEFAGVAFAAGLSGHGFKFTCVLGKLLAEMVVDGRTSLACEFLSLRRFGA